MSARDSRPRSEADEEGAAGAGAGRLGRGEQAAVKAADDEDEQEQRRPDVAQRFEALLPRAARPGRQEVRPHPADDGDRHHVHHHGEDAGDDAGDEQLADVLLGDQAVDREHGRRRDHDAERAAGRDHAGRERLRIAVAAHLRIGDARERRGGRDRRAADRGEAAAGRDGGDAEPAAQMAEEGVGGAEQLAAHARRGRERAHQQEQRDDREIEVGHRPHRGVADVLERRPAADEIGEAADADEAHRHADRHAQQHQHEQRDEPDDGDGVGAHRAHSTGWTRAGLRQQLGMEDQPVGADGDQQHGGDIAEPGHREERPDRQPQIEGQHMVGAGAHRPCRKSV